MTIEELFDGLALDYESGDGWAAAHGDNIELMHSMKPSCVDLTVTSIPFSSLFTYSASDRDAGNVKDDDQFFKQFASWVTEMLRVTKPGRICAIHCMLLPSSKTRDGFIGLKDFRGDVVRAMQHGGWIFHSETAIRKDPVVAVQRTKALGLLHKQLKKDSCMSRTGINDYLVAFRKPGVNVEPVTHTNESYPVRKWQQVAEPVWLDVNQTETLNGRSAREDADEAHLCVLQTQVIERCIELWSNPGNFVFDPYGGIGSTGVVALEQGRQTAICELKKSYWDQAKANLAAAEPRAAGRQVSIFDVIGKEASDAT